MGVSLALVDAVALALADCEGVPLGVELVDAGYDALAEEDAVTDAEALELGVLLLESDGVTGCLMPSTSVALGVADADADCVDVEDGVDDGEDVAEGDEFALRVGVRVGVAVGVYDAELVPEGVADAVVDTDDETDGVAEYEGVCEGVPVGVAVPDGVGEGETEGVEL